MKHPDKWYQRRLSKYFDAHYSEYEDDAEWWSDPEPNQWLFDIGQYEFAKDDEIIRGSRFPKIKNVIFNEPATIVFWSDNTKTVVKCYEEPFDPEKGITMAYAKKVAEMNGESGYYRQIKKWTDKYWEQEEKRLSAISSFSK